MGRSSAMCGGLDVKVVRGVNEVRCVVVQEASGKYLAGGNAVAATGWRRSSQAGSTECRARAVEAQMFHVLDESLVTMTG